MAKIKVTSKCEIYDGMSITFKAPCAGTAVDGLNVHYTNSVQTFSFRDAHKNDLAGLDHLFAEGTYVKVILDTRNGYAYLQNADTNGFLKESFANVHTKEETLTDATRSLLNISANATPNEAFAKLALGAGKYGYDITVLNPINQPVVGMTVAGVETVTGAPAVTDKNGKVLGVSTNTSVTVSVTSPYYDLNSVSKTIVSTGIITSATLVMTATRTANQIITFNQSKNIVFSPYVKEIDLCAVGGGGGGVWAGGGGGSGGFVANLLKKSVTPGVSYSLTVGAGGNNGDNGGGGTGGTSTVTENGVVILTANGGKGPAGSQAAAVGEGNGLGAQGYRSNSAATAGTGYKFEDPSLGVAGGGGGGRGAAVYSNISYSSGAGPYGGDGGRNASTNGSDGRGPGGGGGGGASGPKNGEASHSYGGNGAAGAIFMRMRFAA